MSYDETEPIYNFEDIIDSREVIARIEYLEDPDNDRHAEHREELATLVALRDEASDYAPDWENGVTLIRDTYFETYAQELAEDTGAIPENLSWPVSCIDWEQASRELQMDYTSVGFDGVTYWIR